MKLALTLIFTLIATAAFSQADGNGSPVFNSVIKKEEQLPGYKLIYSYYTLKNNIDHKTSSVYISSLPTDDQIIKAATGLPSDNFMILKDQFLVDVIMLNLAPRRNFFVISAKTGKERQFPLAIEGDITENRAAEIIKNRYDSSARIEGGHLFFNKEKLRIIPNDSIRAAVITLIQKEKLDGDPVSENRIPTQKEVRERILAETAKGGRLDFFTPIIGREFEGVQVKPGVYTTMQSLALYQWGKAAFELGLNTVEDALSIYETFKGRKLNIREQDYITMGFDKGLEK